MHDIFIFTLLFGSGIMAGICNATAGGGTFFTFPVFLAAGLPPIVANASNAIAVWPGHALAVVAYRHELRTHPHGLRLSLLLGVNDTLKLSHLPRSMFKKRGVKVSHC